MTEVNDILESYKRSQLSREQAVAALHRAYIADLGHTTLDLHRAGRVGAAEVVYGEGKTPDQLRQIVLALVERGQNVLVTRVGDEGWRAVQRALPDARYNELARTITYIGRRPELAAMPIAVVTAGTSDQHVAEEAAVTAEFYGNTVFRIADVGVAGIHRLFAKLDELRKARIAIVVAGMEGALPSVVGGLVKMPIIAVPTSVGYGASFAGLAALLGMLNSCAAGVSVVNIDNGFGAGYLASLINRSNP
jgi:pyridinium-3,5-biscarboxylic acid mononucleotide synthase